MARSRFTYSWSKKSGFKAEHTVGDGMPPRRPRPRPSRSGAARDGESGSPRDFFDELHRFADRVEEIIDKYRHAQAESNVESERPGPPERAAAADASTGENSAGIDVDIAGEQSTATTADGEADEDDTGIEQPLSSPADHGGASGPPGYEAADPLKPQVPALRIEPGGEPTAPPPGLPATKFGGQPDWLDNPLWPLSRQTGEQMEFIAQFALHPDDFPWLEEPKVAYLFVTNDEFDPGGIEIWEPFAGENAVIVQPGDRPGWVEVIESATGPTVGEGIGARLTPSMDPSVIPDHRKSELDRAVYDRYISLIDYDKLGGTPNFFQGVEMPVFEDRSTSRDPQSGAIPIFVTRSAGTLNLGDAGRGVAFLSADHRLGAYLWFN